MREAEKSQFETYKVLYQNIFTNLDYKTDEQIITEIKVFETHKNIMLENGDIFMMGPDMSETYYTLKNKLGLQV